MPITFAPPEADRIPSGLDTMFETRPPVGVETPAPKPLNKESAWVAAAGISTWKGIGDAIYSPGFNDDPNFNPFEHIRKTPRLASDPMVQFLIERGQFDNAGSMEEFEAQLSLGQEFVRDSQTVANSSAPFMLQLVAGVADPINVATMAAAPFTGGASLGFTSARSTLGAVAKAAAVGAASNMASKLLQNQVQPVSNEPGMGDDFVAGMSGAVFGGGVGWLTHAIGNNAKSMPSTRRMQMVRKGINDLAKAEIPQTIGDRTPMAREAAVRPKPADVAPVVVDAAETPVPPPVMDDAPNAALDEVPDAVLAQRPEADPADAGPDAPPFDASVPLSAKQARSLARQQAKDMVESGEWDESNVGWLARQLQQTADDVERWIRPVVDRTAASVEAAKTKAKLAADAQLTDSQRGLTEAMSNQGVPFEMIDGLDQAVSDANSAPLPTKTPTAEPTPPPLSDAAAASADAIQEKLTRPNPAKVWRSRRGFVFNPFASSKPKVSPQKPGPTVPTMTLDDAVKHELDNGYLPFLADVPDPHRTLYVLNNATPEVSKAIDDIRAKYKAANTPLNEVEHPLQGYNDLIQHVRTLTSTPAFNTAATAAELDQGILSNITTAAAGKGMGLINPITPAGRVSGITPSAEIPDAIVSQIQETMRTIAGSVQTVTRGNAVAPFTHMSPTAAEAIKGLVAHQKDMTRLALIDTYNSARRAGRDVIEYGNTKISSRFGYSAFKDAVTDYYRAMNARAAGHDGPIPPNVDPAIVKAADHLKKHFNAQRDRMIEVGMLPDTNAALKEVTDLFNRRAALTVKHQKALAAEQAKMIPNPQRVAKLQSWLASSSKRESALSDRLRSLQRNIDMQDWYMPRTYDVWTIRRNETAFTEDLETAFHSNDNFDRSGTRVTNPDQRPMLASVAEKLDRDALEKAIQAKDPNFSFTKAAQNKKGTAADIQTQVMHEAVANMDEGNLPSALQDAYREQLTAYYRGKAQGAFQAIAGKNAEGSRQLAARQMQGVDETVLNRWMEQDVDRLIERSHHAIEGRYSIRKSIQLSDTMRRRTLSDGSPIRTEEDLLKFSTDLIDSLLERFGKNNDLIAPDTRLALEKMRANVHRDMKGMIDALTGNAAVTADNQLLPGASFVGRQLLKLNFLNKMGGAVLNTVNDLAPMSLNVMRAPETWRPIWDAVRGLRNMAEDDLHAIDAGFDGLIRTRQMGDIDLESSGIGIDGSTLKKITGAIDAGTDQMTGLMAKAGLINWVTNMQKRTAGVVTINWATKMSKKLLKAAQAAGVDPDEAAQKAALNAAGLNDAYDLARLNKMGFNSQAALEYHQQVYKHGLLRDDTPVSSAMSFAEYLDDTRFVKPNFGDWDAGSANNKLRLMAGMSNEVNRYHVITPGIGDIPLFQARYPILGKMFNQFQTFGLAFGNQRLAAMAQMPAKYQTYYVGVYLMLGALSDAVKQHLSGRRTLEDTAAQWEEKPLGMLYGAWHTSGLSGWLQRPLAILDNMNVPFSPGVVAGNITGGTAARHFNPQQLESVLGPVASDIGRGMRLVGPASNSIYNALGGTATGDTWNTQNTQSAWKLAPFQNLFWLRLGHKTTGLPLVPESLSPN